MRVGIIDYGSGNIRSVFKSFEKAASLVSPKIHIKVIDNIKELNESEKIVLPGVGAFADCMKGLEKHSGLIEMLTKKVLEENKAFLGICVGMQLLANYSKEYGHTDGLAWIDGEVTSIKTIDSSIKIPHMGWNELKVENASNVFKDEINNNHAYFIHSYEFVPKDKKNVSITTNYGKDVMAAVSSENIYGSQFHPEKSQQTGIQILTNFLNL